jgi:hypothetical protein
MVVKSDAIRLVSNRCNITFLNFEVRVVETLLFTAVTSTCIHHQSSIGFTARYIFILEANFN